MHAPSLSSASLTLVASSLLALLTHAATDAGQPPRRLGQAREGRLVLRSAGTAQVLIRGGHFRMGSTIPEVAQAQALCRREPLGRECTAITFADEMTAHEVMVSDFWIDRTEVTSAAYRRCIIAGVCRPPAHASNLLWEQVASLPITLVSWYDAVRYCNWVGARLPTEAEWERAAKGWSGRTYPWGLVFNPKISNHGRFAPEPLDDGDGFAELAPVGSFPQGRTPEGVEDLAGNIEEWVADWYTIGYVEADMVDPLGPAIGDERVIRGGSYRSGRAWLRAAARLKDLPSQRRAWRGFRCARPADPTTAP